MSTIITPNIVSTHVEVDELTGEGIFVEDSGSSVQKTEVKDVEVKELTSEELLEETKKILSKIQHINPISTEINITSVADQLSNYQFAPGISVSVDELLNPIYGIDYEAHPVN